MNKGPNTSVVISISSKNISPNCKEVIQSLRRSGIAANVSPNHTIIFPHTHYGTKENGCRITFGIPSKKNTFNTVENVWNTLKSSLDIQCSHLNVNLNWGGCIYDYLRPTNCPGNKNSQ